MKTGRTLTELAAEIERQQNMKQDFVVSTEHISMEPTTVGGGLGLRFGDHELGITALTHSQVAEHTKVPQRYYDRCLAEKPALLAQNVNTWFRAQPVPRMVRCLDRRARAFLSDRYRPLENADLAEAVLPTLMDNGLQVVSCEITERRLYIKCVDPRIERDVPRGARMGDGSHHIFDTLCPAMTIANSEVGSGALSVEVGTLTRACTNLAFFSQRGLRKYHLGGRHDMGDDLYRLLSTETRAASDRAVWLQVRDTVRAAFDEAKFDALVGEISQTAERPITGDPVKVVEVTRQRMGLSEGQGRSVLRHLIEGGDLSQYGLSNAVTRTAEDQPDYEEASRLERWGAGVIELEPRAWSVLAAAE
jgi:hypothetical protein